jgi:hypothetical protein
MSAKLVEGLNLEQIKDILREMYKGKWSLDLRLDIKEMPVNQMNALVNFETWLFIENELWHWVDFRKMVNVLTAGV